MRNNLDEKVMKALAGLTPQKTALAETFEEKLSSTMTEFKTGMLETVNSWEKQVDSICDYAQDVKELAEEVYPEGHDYYGRDYVAQRLPAKYSKVLNDFIENKEPDDLWQFHTDLVEIEKLLKSYVVDLRKELKEVKEKK